MWKYYFLFQNAEQQNMKSVCDISDVGLVTVGRANNRGINGLRKHNVYEIEQITIEFEDIIFVTTYYFNISKIYKGAHLVTCFGRLIANIKKHERETCLHDTVTAMQN